MTRPRAIVPILALLALTSWAVACGDGGTEPTPPPDPPRATTLTVTPATASLTALDETVRLAAEVRDQNGRVMAGATVTWTSGDASVAAVDGSGLVTAAGNGSATITATSGAASGSATVTVAQAVSAVAISPAADTLVAEGDTVRLTAEARDANGHAVAGSEFAWASSDASVAAVDGTGLVTGVAEGKATITAAAGRASGTAEITVQLPGPRATLSANETSVREGGTLEVTVHVDPPPPTEIAVAYTIGLDSDPSTANADAADFTSGTGGTVTISSGLTTGSFEVVVNDDADIEAPREVFSIALSDPGADAEYALGAADSVTLVRAINEGICDRTSRVRDELLERVGVQLGNRRRPDIGGCASVTREHLAWVTHLALNWWASAPHSPIDSLKARDFSDLVGLRWLALNSNRLRSLPPRVFAGLANLESLNLGWNEIASLPEGVFDGLVNLEWLFLLNLKRVGGEHVVFPKGMFSDLASLRELHICGVLPESPFVDLRGLEYLNISGCSGLQPVGLLAGLTSLKRLEYREADLVSLPDSFFVGLAKLEQVNLRGHPGSPFPLSLELERTDTENPLAQGPATVRARLGPGTPFEITAPLSVVNGSVSLDSLTVGRGATASTGFTVGAGDLSSPTYITMGRHSGIPAGFEGLELVPARPLSLFAVSENSAPAAEGALPHHVLQVGGPRLVVDMASYFSDPDGDDLSYAARPNVENVADVSVEGTSIVFEPRTADMVTWTVTATDPVGLSAWQDIEMTVLPAPDNGAFDIDLVFLKRRSGGSGREAKIRQAADRWERIITRDLPDVPVHSGNTPYPGVSFSVGAIDDLIVFVAIDATRTAGWARVRGVRASSHLPYSSELHILPELTGDRANLLVPMHEFGHTLGIGTVWRELALLQNPTSSHGIGADTHFSGSRAIEAFDAAGGTEYTGGGKVPVENVHPAAGSRDSHWRTSVVGGELMNHVSGSDIAGGSALSAITIQSLADLGYEVDLGQADAYTLPSSGGAAAAAAPESAIDLRGDVVRGSVVVVDRAGRVVRVLHDDESALGERHPHRTSHFRKDGK